MSLPPDSSSRVGDTYAGEPGRPDPWATKDPREGLRDTDEARVVSLSPDVCLTPRGGSPVPVPYPIVDYCGHDNAYANSVRFTQLRAMVLRSNTTHVHGDKPGTAGGVKSGTVGDITEPIGHAPQVRAEDSPVIRHLDALEVGLAVGDRRVGLRVHGPRQWEPTLHFLKPTWKLGQAEPVTRVALDYRLTAGGRFVGDPGGTASEYNPIGPGLLHRAWSPVCKPLRAPQIEAADAPLDDPFAVTEPRGFGPAPRSGGCASIIAARATRTGSGTAARRCRRISTTASSRRRIPT